MPIAFCQTLKCPQSFGQQRLLLDAKDIPVHCLSEPRLVHFRRDDGRLGGPTTDQAPLLDPGLEFLVPGVGPDKVDDADNQFVPLVVNADDEGVIHHVVLCEEKSVVV